MTSPLHFHKLGTTSSFVIKTVLKITGYHSVVTAGKTIILVNTVFLKNYLRKKEASHISKYCTYVIMKNKI